MMEYRSKKATPAKVSENAKAAYLDHLLGITGALDILAKEGIEALFEALRTGHGLNEKSKAVIEALDFIIEDDGQRLEAKRAALKVAPHIHTSLFRQIGQDALEQAYDVALFELQRATAPAPPPSGLVSGSDRNIGKSALDQTFGVSLKSMSGSDQIELTHRRAEALGLSPYLISGLSKALGDGWSNVLDQLQYAFAGVKLK